MAASFPVGVFAPQGWRMDLVDIPDPVAQYEAMTRVAQEAERLGFDSVWLYDHFHTVPQHSLNTTFECWTSMAGLARDTQRIRLGQMVTCNGYRSPALLAKIASTVDVMSHGRLDFGIGAGWYEHEYRAFGYDYPDAPTRLKMLGEAVQIIRAMWTEDYATFQGRFYQVNGAINQPKGVQKPHPPLWIGGSGEKVTLKLVAQYGDACNIGAGNQPDLYRHKFAVLREHCDKLDRDYDGIVRSANLNVFLLEPGEVSRAEGLTAHIRGATPLADYRKENFIGTAPELIDVVGRLREAGVTYLILYVHEAAHLERLQAVGRDVLPHIRG